MMPKHRKKRWAPIYSVILTLLSTAVVAAYLVAARHVAVESRRGDKSRPKGSTRSTPCRGRSTLHWCSNCATPAPARSPRRSSSPTTTSATTSPLHGDAGELRRPDAADPRRRMDHPDNDQLDRWLGGEPLPPHSVMITFDDGATGVWQYADPVLKRLDMHATAFIITGFVGTHAPYYMTWDQITELAQQRALGHRGAHPPGSRAGAQRHRRQRGAVPDHRGVAARSAPVRDARGVPTAGECDLTECKHQFVLHGLPEPKFFAYPFSAYRNDREGSGQPQASVVSLYRAGLLDDAEFIAVTSAANVARGLIQRMDITADLSLDKFIRKIELASPLDPPAAQPLSDRRRMVRREAERGGNRHHQRHRDDRHRYRREGDPQLRAGPLRDVERLHGVGGRGRLLPPGRRQPGRDQRAQTARFGLRAGGPCRCDGLLARLLHPGAGEHRPAAAGRSRPASCGDRRDGHPGGRYRR